MLFDFSTQNIFEYIFEAKVKVHRVTDKNFA